MSNIDPSKRQSDFRAMGTDVSADLTWDEKISDRTAEDLFVGIRKIFADNEKIFSRFDPESELSGLNRRLGKATMVSPKMSEVLALCLRFHELSEGYFDPRIIEALEKIGYDRDFRSNDLNDPSKGVSGLEAIKGRLADELQLDDQTRTALIRKRIDTTGIAKGYTVDEAAAYLRKSGGTNFVIDAGGDMFASGKGDGRGWLISVEGLENSPVRIKIEDEGVATSGISRKRWQRGEQKVHHLVNPRHPDRFSRDIRTVTVVAGKAAEADGWAKSLFLMGLEKGLAFAEQKKIKCLFLDYRNNIYVSKSLKSQMA